MAEENSLDFAAFLHVMPTGGHDLASIFNRVSMRISFPNGHSSHAPSAAAPAAKEGGSSFSDALKSSMSASDGTSKYDFTNMSQQQMQAAMGDLYQAGHISFDEMSLAAPLIQSPLAKVAFDGQWGEAYTRPTNWMSTLRAGLDGARSRGDSQGIANITRLVQALERIQGSNG